MTQLDTLLLAIAGAPALPGARCRGKHHLFDDGRKGEDQDIVNERQAQALGLCQRCPALDPCAEWVDTLAKRQRPLGVVAGRLYRTTTPAQPEGQPT